MPTFHLMPKGKEPEKPQDICLFAQTNYRNQMRRFGIKTDDRRRHMYIIGKTGMGKTTMMENMVLNDIYKGHGVGIVDPHGDFAEKIINYIPANRVNDIVYFNPADTNHPIGFNILEVQFEEQKHLIASGLMGTFKKIWPDVWSSRMEYILNNTLLALLDYPGSTLLGINRMLGEKDFRKKVVRQLTDPVVKSFWQNEFENYEPKYQKEAVAPIQNKIGQFLSASVIRNMVAQVKSTINVREIMDTRKIFIMNLSKGRIGEDNSRLLGGMLITKLQLGAMERVDTPEEDRQDFFLYVDEFQNFATPSFANILSEARKYRLSLIMAHQYVAQLDEVVADAVFGNVGTIVSFRVGGGDAEMLAKEFAPQFVEENIVNLSKFSVILKLMIDGVASQPFTAQTMPPIGSPTGSSDKVIRVSRERYGRNRDVIEDKILRWSGMGELHDDEDEDFGEEGKDFGAGSGGQDKDTFEDRPPRREPRSEERSDKGDRPARTDDSPQRQDDDRPRQQDRPRQEDRPQQRQDDRPQRRDDRPRQDRPQQRQDDRPRQSEPKKQETISLKELMSKEDREILAKAAEPQPAQQIQRPATMPVERPQQPVQQPIERPEPQQLEPQNIQSNGPAQSARTGEPEKRKRKRNRKRKNRDGGIDESPTQGNQQPSRPEPFDRPENRASQASAQINVPPKEYPPANLPSLPPPAPAQQKPDATSIDQDEIITFD